MRAMDKRNLAIDAAALAIYLVVANPALTGIGVHEWLGLGLFVMFFVHFAAHADWVVEAVRGSFARPSWARTGNVVLDVLIVLAFMLTTVSGIMVSGAVLLAMGLYAEGYRFWDPLHAVSAKALLALMFLHVVVHWKWIVRAFGKGRGSDGKRDGVR